MFYSYKTAYRFLKMVRILIVGILGSEEFVLKEVRWLLLVLSRCPLPQG
jgi:hypothetical protein